LIRRAEEVKNSLAELQVDFPDNRILHAEEVISMHDDPLEAIKKKKDSSIVRGVQLVKDGQFDAFVSAGHTGAMMTAGTFILGRIKGVSRATMGTPMPNSSGVSTLFDVGATVETSARFLVEYATMGSIYVREIYHIENPTVGLLSVGEEDSKGTEVTIAAHKALRESGLNFIGNLEGRDVLRGSAHVIVCDGFVGNIIIKFAESILPFLRHQFKAYAAKSIIHKLRIALLRGTFKEVMRNVDYQQYGGVPLLGVNGVMIIGHGSSSPLAIKNMIKRAADMHRVNIVEKIASAVQQIKFIS
jgi:glycerol-3-phosphate acyltransferase PlsX